MSRRTVALLVVVVLVLGAAAWAVLGRPGLSALRRAVGHAKHDEHDDDGHGEEGAHGHADKEKAHADKDGHDEHGRKEKGQADKDGHDEHGRKEKGQADKDGHEEHAAEGAKEKAHGEEAETVVRLTPDQAREFGIKVATAGPGVIGRVVRLPGEILINADRAARIVPRAEGIVREVRVRIGDRVKDGQIMAVLESAELSEAESQYLSKLNDIALVANDLKRSKALQASVRRLAALLDKSPTLDDLLKVKFAELGAGHSELLSAYAELVFAKAAYERERKLATQNVSSLAALQTAENAYKKAYAEYIATRGALAFDMRRKVLDDERALHNTELEAQAAERRLGVLGLTRHEADALKLLLKGGKAPFENGVKPAGEDHHLCGDLGRYALRAPFDGTVIAKRITLGEKLEDDADAFTVADMSSVWVDLSVYQKDLPDVRKGQKVRMSFGEGIPDAEGVVGYVFPIVNEKTRTCVARVVLPNPKRLIRPGLFVNATVDVGRIKVPVLLPRDAVRRIEGRTVVFVPDEHGFRAEPVKTGRESRAQVEIVSGLKAGQAYVSAGAFELQAKVVTSGLGAHAGHGH